MKRLAIGGITLLLFLGLSAGAAMAQEPPAQETPAEAPPSCGDCHEQAKAFLANPHARGEVKDGVVSNAACETCHGDGAAHIEGGGDKEKITKPAGLTGAQTCAMCHDGSNEKKSHRTGMHANSASVNCLSCHSIHNADARSPRLLAKSAQELCSTCHLAQAEAFRSKPYTHRVGTGVMDCVTCHEPHGRPGKQSLKLTAAGEAPCLSCHTEKRGPHVFSHGATVVGECSSCHEPHGSANARQLKRATVGQLCTECHSQIASVTLGSQPPSFHNMSTARFQNCTTCHVAIHGSNRSPQLLK
jgi:DmsE family decaheme c-type cytochrome